MDDATAAMIDRLEREVAELRRRVDEIDPRVRRERADLATLRRLLPAMLAALGDAAFTVADLVARAEQHEGLRAALEPAKLNSKQLGNLFSRCQGKRVEYRTIVLRGETSGCTVWQIVAWLVALQEGQIHAPPCAPGAR